MKSNLIRCTLALGGLIPLVAASQAFADITFQFSPALDGGVNVFGSGSGLANRDPNVATAEWTVQDFMTDFLQDTVTGSEITATTASGTFTNVTTGISESILAFIVDRDPTSRDDMDWVTANVLTFNLDDAYQFSLTASFAPATLSYSQLIPGTHIDVGRTQGAGIADESFGITTVNVVPEPAALGLLITCCASIGIVRRRRRTR